LREPGLEIVKLSTRTKIFSQHRIPYPIQDLARNLGSTIHYLKTYNGVQEWMPIQLTSLVIIGKKNRNTLNVV
jgi:hypothetical protein